MKLIKGKAGLVADTGAGIRQGRIRKGEVPARDFWGADNRP